MIEGKKSREKCWSGKCRLVAPGPLFRGMAARCSPSAAAATGSTLRLSCRTGCRALCASLRTVSWVMREVAGGSWLGDGMVAPVTKVEGLKIW